MMKSILAAGVSLLAFTAVTTAQAKTVGHISGQVSYVGLDDDFFGGKDITEYDYNFNGAALFDLTPTWNLQLDSNFQSQKYSGDIFGGKTVGLDTWQAGFQGFWRDPSQGMVGAAVGYNSLEFLSTSLDGIYAGLRGEYYGGDTYTLGASAAYNVFDGKGELNSYTGNVFGTYYSGTQTAISLRGQYGVNDSGGNNNSVDTWGVSADVEYLFQNNLSLAGSVGYASSDLPFATSSLDQFTVGAKLKVYFGTEGSLANQHRTSTLEPIPTQDLPFLF